MLFGSYRRGDANDPDAYVTSITAVLSIFDTDLMREVTDPRTGIQTTEKYMSFMPNAGELKVYCDGIAARRDRIKRLGELPPVKPVAFLPPPPHRPGDLANVFVPSTDRRYARLLRWSETADERHWKYDDKRPGIWVTLEAFSGGETASRSEWKRPVDLTLTDSAKRATGIVDASADQQQDEREDVA